MKLIIKDYIASLNEEVGLNELIPKLYLLKGFTIINKAQKGVRQNGVDILAEKNGCPYLITIKQGNIKRENWNNNPTSLHQSLDDIIDAYIPNELPKKYNGKKIHIDIVFNGYIEQSIQSSLTGYEKRNEKYVFTCINIDGLTEIIYDTLLNENLFPKNEAAMLRKCLVLINEKDFSINTFSQLIDLLINKILNETSLKNLQREIKKLTTIQNIICNWDLDSGVFINKIKCCELLLLRIVTKLISTAKNKKLFENLLHSILQTYIFVLDKYFDNAIKLKYTYRALPIYDEFGHKLKLFEILGALSIYGLVLLQMDGDNTQKISDIRNLIIAIINNYDGTLYIPLESNCSEISLILLFLYRIGDLDTASNYVIGLLNYQSVNYLKYKSFPFPFDDYYEALKNSTSKDVPFTSSLVIENLIEWLVLLCGVNNKSFNVEVFKKAFKDISMQAWSYSADEESKVYQGTRATGCCYIMPKFENGKQYKKVLKHFVKGLDYKKYLVEKKNISYIQLLASRLYRLPVNPYQFLKDLK